MLTLKSDIRIMLQQMILKPRSFVVCILCSINDIGNVLNANAQKCHTDESINNAEESSFKS